MKALVEGIPAGYDRVREVGSFAELAAARLEGAHNCLWLRRPPLQFDFNPVALRLGASSALKLRHLKDRQALFQGTPEEAAYEEILSDMRACRDYGWIPELRVIKKYENPHTYDFHQDGPDRLFRCYTAPVTQLLPYEDAEPVSETKNVFRPRPGARPFQFPLGDMWSHAGVINRKTDTQIHRAVPSNGLRLLLVAER